MKKNIRRLKEIKEKIRLAIVGKGVNIPENASLEDMASKIKEIKERKKREIKNG